MLFEPEIEAQPEYRTNDLDRALSRGDWDSAFRTLDKIASDPRMVKRTDVFVASRDYAFSALGAAPPDFFKEFRRRFDESVRTHDLSLKEWKEGFFCTAMDVRGNLLADECMEAGRPGEALEIWELLLRFYPDPSIPRGVLAGRAMVAAALAGERERLEALPCPSGFVRVGSRTIGLAELKREMLSRVSTRPVSPGRLPKFFFIQSERKDGEPPATRDCLIETVDDAWHAWSLELQFHGKRIPLFSSRAHFINFEDAAAIHYGNFVLWSTTDGPSGVVDTLANAQVWAGPLADAPVPARCRDAVRCALSEPFAHRRASASLRLAKWGCSISYRDECASSYNDHRCGHTAYEPYLVVTEDRILWICPCSEVRVLKPYDHNRLDKTWKNLDAADLPEPLKARIRLFLAGRVTSARCLNGIPKL